VRAHGDFAWHDHTDTNALEHAPTVDVSGGELFVVPRGVRHRPMAEGQCWALILEPAATVNTCEVGGELSAAEQWI